MGLIEQIPWRGVFLTPEGETLAQQSRERHQIVENFLLALGVNPDTARRDAEGMEHHVSEETLEVFHAKTRRHIDLSRFAHLANEIGNQLDVIVDKLAAVGFTHLAKPLNMFLDIDQLRHFHAALLTCPTAH